MLNKPKIKAALISLVSSPHLRLYFSISVGLAINAIYFGANLHSAFMHRTFWSIAATVYYLLFGILRFYLLRASKRDEKSKNRCCLTVGVFLLILTVSAGAVIAHNVINETDVKYSGYVLIGFSIYTIYSITTSLIGMKKWLNDNQPLHFAAKGVTFAAALMSAFNLQYSLLFSLGLSDETVRRMNAFGGFTVFLCIAVLGAAIVVKGIGTVRN